MKHLNKNQMKDEVRRQIKKLFGSPSNFADHLGIDVNAVYAVLNQDRDVPRSWMETLGYERVVVYKKDSAQKKPKDIAVDIAKKHALIAGKKSDHNYLPSSKEDLDSWEPHEWVVNAIRGALAMKSAEIEEEF